MKHKWSLIGLMGIFVSLLILITINAVNNIATLLLGLIFFVGYYLIVNGKKEYQSSLELQFTQFTQDFLLRHQIIGTIKNTTGKELNCDYLIFLPNKILVFYLMKDKGIITINENIYNSNNKVLKNITKVKNSYQTDILKLQNLYNDFRRSSFEYNNIPIVPVCYIHDAQLIQNFNHNIIFSNKFNVEQVIHYEVLDNNIVYPYEEFIDFLTKKNILSTK